MQAAERLQLLQNLRLFPEQAGEGELSQAGDAHAKLSAARLRLAILERTTAARSASER